MLNAIKTLEKQGHTETFKCKITGINICGYVLEQCENDHLYACIGASQMKEIKE